jgi:hypothetical protein
MLPVLAFHESATECDEPDNDAVAAPVASLVMLAVPPLDPVPVGANCTVRVADWPGLRISPGPTPLPLKPAPVTVTPEIVTLEFPVFVNVVGSEALCPDGTVPKFNVAGLTLKKRLVAAPVPVKVTIN